MPKGTPLTDHELARKRGEIAQAAISVFLAKGFQESSVREIAEAAGIGKSTLYDYFKTKEDILLFVAEKEVVHLTRNVQEIASRPLTVIEKLRQIVSMHLDYLVNNKDFYLMLTFELQRLSPESQRHIQLKRHVYQDLLREMIAQGIQQGVFRPVDPMLAARVLFTALLPIVFTSRPSGSPQNMMEEAFEMLMRGIQA